MRMKDGSYVKDARLGRIYQYDPANRKYKIRGLIRASRPRSYTWRCHLVLDQGKDGSCVGCGVTAELAARPAEVPNLNYKFARERIYWEAQKLDEWPGGSWPGAKPFYEGTSVLAGVKVAKRLGFCGGYYWALNFDDLVMGVSWHGPAIIGINWYTGMFQPNSDGFIKISGLLAGGHCCLLTSVNLRKEYFVLHNSWGESWGDGGKAKIDFATMRRLLREDGEAVFLTRRKSKP